MEGLHSFNIHLSSVFNLILELSIDYIYYLIMIINAFEDGETPKGSLTLIPLVMLYLFLHIASHFTVTCCQCSYTLKLTICEHNFYGLFEEHQN